MRCSAISKEKGRENIFLVGARNNKEREKESSFEKQEETSLVLPFYSLNLSASPHTHSKIWKNSSKEEEKQEEKRKKGGGR